MSERHKVEKILDPAPFTKVNHNELRDVARIPPSSAQFLQGDLKTSNFALNGAQIESIVLHGRAPVIRATNGAREPEECIRYTVFLTRHPPELYLEGLKRLAERNEHQAFSIFTGKRHRAAQYKRMRRKTLLLGSLDVSRQRGILDL